MKSIARKFMEIREKRPFWSSFVCFTYCVIGKKISRPMLAKYFNKLVEKDDYLRSERKWLVPYIHSLTNHPEESDFEG